MPAPPSGDAARRLPGCLVLVHGWGRPQRFRFPPAAKGTLTPIPAELTVAQFGAVTPKEDKEADVVASGRRGDARTTKKGRPPDDDVLRTEYATKSRSRLARIFERLHAPIVMQRLRVAREVGGLREDDLLNWGLNRLAGHRLGQLLLSANLTDQQYRTAGALVQDEMRLHNAASGAGLPTHAATESIYCVPLERNVEGRFLEPDPNGEESVNAVHHGWAQSELDPTDGDDCSGEPDAFEAIELQAEGEPTIEQDIALEARCEQAVAEQPQRPFMEEAIDDGVAAARARLAAAEKAVETLGRHTLRLIEALVLGTAVVRIVDSQPELGILPSDTFTVGEAERLIKQSLDIVGDTIYSHDIA